MTVLREVQYFEDYEVGVVKKAGSLSLSEAEVIESRRSNSNPKRGLLHTRAEDLNQDGVMVMSMKAFNLVACRNTVS